MTVSKRIDPVGARQSLAVRLRDDQLECVLGLDLPTKADAVRALVTLGMDKLRETPISQSELAAAGRR